MCRDHGDHGQKKQRYQGNLNWEFDKVKHAVDTRLFLDGSEKPSNSALHLIGQFSKYPGLKPNIDKTKCIWIGANKNSEVP